ncbi:hypothetical protein CJ030_MR2G016445 [Morella rubra]|uniref:Uncharacterized protein n=1 Tax=Morella rubra TaxID=262757 RepID=A0A6A1WCW6_9ROSI|nr:hypothetical protein CJ030_MR2G016445 [Morella rubra]
MKAATKKKKLGLPYGMLFMHIFHILEVDMTGEIGSSSIFPAASSHEPHLSQHEDSIAEIKEEQENWQTVDEFASTSAELQAFVKSSAQDVVQATMDILVLHDLDGWLKKFELSILLLLSRNPNLLPPLQRLHLSSQLPLPPLPYF